MAECLRAYRAKRDLEATPEPRGRTVEPAGDHELSRFVIQEHHARALHWDLRLERDGVLVSWALPKGIPSDPSRNNLAVRTEDHPLEYLDFAGVIPKGSYGAGTMSIWDQGTYETEKFRDDEVIIVFHGERARGRHVLFRTDGKRWMIHRMDPSPEGLEPMPERIEPMLAKLGSLPRGDDGWAFEIKWDGVRAITYVRGGRLRLESRNGRDITRSYPELRALGVELGSTEAVLDGEIVALDDQGRPSFSALQRRMHVDDSRKAQRLAEQSPVHLLIFDVLFLDGRSLLARPHEERRAALSELGLAGPTWRVPANHVGEGEALLAASREQGLEGVIAKRLGSAYEPGRRSGAWIKVKNVTRQLVVIGGWLPGAGSRSGRIGALLAGVQAQDGLRYVGRVGTGFDARELERLGDVVAALARDATPFSGRQPPREARFIEPTLVAEVEFTEWTHTGTLRHPSYKGLKDGVEPSDVVRG